MQACCGSHRIYQFVKEWKDTLVVRLKIMVTHFQVVTTFPIVLDVQWPDSFNRYADRFSSRYFWGEGVPGFLKTTVLFNSTQPPRVTSTLLLGGVMELF